MSFLSFNNTASIVLYSVKFRFFFGNKLVYLVYRGVLVSFDQGGTCVACPPFYVFSAPFFILSSRSACGGWWWWAGVYVGFGFWWGWVGIVIPGVLT